MTPVYDTHDFLKKAAFQAPPIPLYSSTDAPETGYLGHRKVKITKEYVSHAVSSDSSITEFPKVKNTGNGEISPELKYSDSLSQHTLLQYSLLPQIKEATEPDKGVDGSMTNSLIAFVNNAMGEPLPVQEISQFSAVFKTLLEIKGSREELKKLLADIRPHLAALEKVDIKSVRTQKSFSEVAQKRKEAVITLLNNLNLLADTKSNLTEFKGNESYDLMALSDPCIINTFRESVWIPLQELRINLEKAGFAEKIKSISLLLKKLAEQKAQYLKFSEQENSSPIKDFPNEDVIDKETKDYLTANTTIASPETVSPEQNFKTGTKKHSLRKVPSSNLLERIRDWILGACLSFAAAMKYLWRTFWY